MGEWLLMRRFVRLGTYPTKSFSYDETAHLFIKMHIISALILN